MFRIGYIAVSALLLLGADVQQGFHSQPKPPAAVQIPADQNIPVLPQFNTSATGAGVSQGAGASNTAGDQAQTNPGAPAQPVSLDGAQPSAPDAAATQPKAAVKNGPLTERSKLELIRYVSGEFARLVTPLPGGKDGFHLKAGVPVDQNSLHAAVRNAGAALNIGDSVQITKIAFRGHEIAFDINGGGRGHTSWRDHIQLGVGGVSPVQTGTTTTDPNAAGIDAPKKTGATLYLDFGHSVPDMTADQLKQYLSAVLDFSKQRSAAVQWVDTLPPKVQEAIQQKRADVGMDHDEVLAALGRPDRKVRERDADGNDTEDWIYGRPPSKTVFVHFVGDKVAKVDRYP